MIRTQISKSRDNRQRDEYIHPIVTSKVTSVYKNKRTSMDSLTPVVEVGAEELSAEEQNYLKEKRLPACSSWVRTDPCRMVVPRRYMKFKVKMQEFEFRPEDIVMMSYPKTGSTWMSEILWAMSSPDKLYLAEEEGIQDRIYFLHNDFLRPSKEDDDTTLMKRFQNRCPGMEIEDGVTLNLARVAPDRRVIRTSILPPLLHHDMLNTCKVVYVLRNPKDTCVSFYNYRRDCMVFPFLGDFQEFFDIFTSDTMIWGTYGNHVREMWQRKGHPNIHFVFYEDLKRDLLGELEKLNGFFELHLSNEQLSSVAQHVSLKNMKRLESKAPFVTSQKGTFFKQGRIGGWKSFATADLECRMDKWIKEQFEGLDIDFKYQ